MPLNTLLKKVKYRIARSKDDVFVLKDFDDLSDRDQIGRALRSLVEREELVRISQGMYAKTRVSKYTGEVVLEKPLIELAKSALERLGVKVRQSQAFADYNGGKTTQVPTGRVIAVDGRVSRKFKYKNNELEYEYAIR